MSGKTGSLKSIQRFAVISSEIKHEFLETDPMILVEAKKTTLVEKELAMTKDSADKVITALLCLPGGIQKMSFQMKGLVQTSLNLGIMKDGERPCFAVILGAKQCGIGKAGAA